MCYGSFPTRKASIFTVESYVAPKFTRGDLLAFGGFFIYNLSKLFQILNKFIKCSFVLFKMAGFQIYLQLRAMLSQSLRGEIYWHFTPARTLSISGLKSRVLKLSFLSLKMMVKSGIEYSEIPAKLPGQFSHSRQIFLH